MVVPADVLPKIGAQQTVKMLALDAPPAAIRVRLLANEWHVLS